MCQGNQLATLSELIGCVVLLQGTLHDDNVANCYGRCVGSIRADATVSLQEVCVACGINEVEGDVVVFCAPSCWYLTDDTCGIDICQAIIRIDGSASICDGIWVGLCACMSEDGIDGGSYRAHVATLHGNGLDGRGRYDLDGSCVESALCGRLCAVCRVIDFCASHFTADGYPQSFEKYAGFGREGRCLDGNCRMCQGNQLATLSKLVGCVILRQVSINDDYIANLNFVCLCTSTTVSLQEFGVAFCVHEVEGDVLIFCTICCRDSRNDTCCIDTLSAFASIDGSASLSDGIWS